MSTIHAALEIGTTRTVLAIGEADGNGRLHVTNHAEIPTSGVRKSQIVDLKHATDSVRGVLHSLEKNLAAAGTNLSLGNAFLVLSGQHIKADPHQGTWQVDDARVDESDMNEVWELAKVMSLPQDREVLDVLEQDYEIDSTGGITSPRGMAGRVLKLNTLHVHADRRHIQDARTAAEAAHLELRDPLCAITCAADAVLGDADRSNGVLVIDFGGGSTGYAVYGDGLPLAVGVIGVGGDHITSDIAHAFQTTRAQAEDLKIRAASAILRDADADAGRIHLSGSSPLMETRTVSRRALETVVNARQKELLAILREQIDARDLAARLRGGVVLTGGGAALHGLDTLVERELNLPVRLGKPIHVDGLEEVEAPESFAAIAGALQYAHRNYEEKPLFGNLFGGFFK